MYSALRKASLSGEGASSVKQRSLLSVCFYELHAIACGP
jgi:hypothetical protein